MANNIADSKITVIPDTEEVEIYALNLYAFKTAKFLVSVVDETNEQISTFETLVSFKKQPSTTAIHQTSTPIGDSISYTYSVEFVAGVPVENDKVSMKILNSSGSELKVYVGEIERVE